MTERGPRFHESVFGRLVAVMVTMAASLVFLMSVFFWLVVMRDVHALIDLQVAHIGLLVVFSVVVVGIVLGAHLVMKRLLRPLRVLSDGVARLGAGELDVRLPRSTRDEFGRLTDAFNQMVGRVKEMIGARDQLLIDVSHELRSPITRMKVALELLPDDGHRARLAGDVEEMERMVSELLELERLRSRRGISTTRQDLVCLLREVAGNVEDERLGVRVVSSAPELMVDIDGEKVRTVFRNLLENARKYSRPESRPVEVAAVDDGDSITVRVTDDGVGIPESDVERVFEPFYRVDRSRAKSSGGYGLGLSICKRVMEAHDGSIAVERPSGGGTSFVLTFPKPGPASRV